MKNNIKNILIALLVFTSVNLIQPTIVQAATIGAVYDKSTVAPGSTISIPIQIDPTGFTPNAFEGSIEIPNGASFVSIDDTESIVSAWVERPSFRDGQVTFSGIVPGGFSGILSPYSNKLLPGNLFSLVVSLPTAGSVSFVPVLRAAYEKDGVPITDNFSSKQLTISVRSGAEVVNQEKTFTQDIYPPEPFEVQIAKDQSIFDGKYFIVFNTYDRGSGVSFYSVEEGERDPVTVESPYVLVDQDIKSRIVVRAYDNAGNFREEYVSSQTYSQGVNRSLFVWGIIVLILLVAIGISRRYFTK
jgi:hypothetical protein